MPTPLLIGGISLGTGILNYLSEQSKLTQEQENLKSVLGILESEKINSAESTSNADLIGDYFNMKTLDALNNSSVGLATAGVVNPESVKAKITGALLGDKQKALIDQRAREDQINRDITLKEAEVKAGMPVNNGLESLVSGTVAGVNLGFSLENFAAEMDNNKKLADYFDEIFNKDKNESAINWIKITHGDLLR